MPGAPSISQFHCEMGGNPRTPRRATAARPTAGGRVPHPFHSFIVKWVGIHEEPLLKKIAWVPHPFHSFIVKWVGIHEPQGAQAPSATPQVSQPPPAPPQVVYHRLFADSRDWTPSNDASSPPRLPFVRIALCRLRRLPRRRPGQARRSRRPAARHRQRRPDLPRRRRSLRHDAVDPGHARGPAKGPRPLLLRRYPIPRLPRLPFPLRLRHAGLRQCPNPHGPGQPRSLRRCSRHPLHPRRRARHPLPLHRLPAQRRHHRLHHRNRPLRNPPSPVRPWRPHLDRR